MQDGLPVLGSRTTVRWLGSTAVEMVIGEGRMPFASMTLVIFLEARDRPWMWALGRGWRDTLIVRGALRRAPSFELEALDRGSWSGREAVTRIPRKWPVREGSIVVHHEDAAALAHADALLALAKRAGLRVRRLSVRRSEPNFQLHVPVPDCGRPAREFFEAVTALAERTFA